MSETTALSTIEALTPAVAFRGPGGIEDVLNRLEADVRGIAIDITTDKGRKHCASVAYQVARSKTALEKMGADLKEDAKKVVDGVNADLRTVRSRCDALRDEVRAPLDEFEEREKARVHGHQQAIHAVEWLARFEVEPSESAVRLRLDELATYQGRDWQEFSARGAQAFSSAKMTLDAHAQAATARRIAAEQAAEQARIEAKAEAERQENARIEREARIAKEAADHAAAEAERRAQAERHAAAQREQEIRDRAERAEREAAAAAKRAEDEKQAAAAKAERDQVAAIEAERARVAAEAAKAKAEAERREADKAHKGRINREVLAAIKAIGISEDHAKALIGALARREIPHVALSY